MRKLGKDSGAIGFAVYLDLIDGLEDAGNEYDTDVVVVYSDNVSAQKLFALVNEIRESGERVTVRKTKPTRLKYKKLIELNE